MKYFSSLVNKHISSKVKRYISVLNVSIWDISAVELFSKVDDRTKNRMLC